MIEFMSNYHTRISKLLKRRHKSEANVKIAGYNDLARRHGLPPFSLDYPPLAFAQAA